MLFSFDQKNAVHVEYLRNGTRTTVKVTLVIFPSSFYQVPLTRDNGVNASLLLLKKLTRLMRRDIVLKETVLRRWFYNAVDRKNKQCRLLYRAVLSKESITCTNLKFFQEEPAGSFFCFFFKYLYMYI